MGLMDLLDKPKKRSKKSETDVYSFVVILGNDLQISESSRRSLQKLVKKEFNDFTGVKSLNVDILTRDDNNDMLDGDEMHIDVFIYKTENSRLDFLEFLMSFIYWCGDFNDDPMYDGNNIVYFEEIRVMPETPDYPNY